MSLALLMDSLSLFYSYFRPRICVQYFYWFPQIIFFLTGPSILRDHQPCLDPDGHRRGDRDGHHHAPVLHHHRRHPRLQEKAFRRDRQARQPCGKQYNLEI